MSKKPKNGNKRPSTQGKIEGTKYPRLKPLWIGVFIDILGFYIIIPFLPAFIELYHTTPLVVGLILATNAIFTLLSAPLWGKLSDKFGRKYPLLFAQFGTFSAFLLLAFSNSIELIFIARMIDGIFGGNFPIVKAIISDEVPPRDRGVQMTNIGVVHVMAGLLAPGLGGFLSLFQPLGPEFPLAALGFVAAGFSAITMIITLLFIKESWPKSRRETMEKQLKVKIKLRKNKDASYLLTQYSFHTFSFIFYVSTLTLYIGIVLGYDIIGISILLTISGLSRAIVRFTLFKPTLNKLGEKNMTILGLFLLFSSFFLIGFVQNIIGFIVLMVFISYGASCSRGLLISKVTQSVSPKEMGKINGYTTTLDSLGQVIGPLVGGLLLSFYVEGTLGPYWIGIIMGVLGLIAFLMVFRDFTPYMIKMQQMEEKQANPNNP